MFVFKIQIQGFAQPTLNGPASLPSHNRLDGPDSPASPRSPFMFQLNLRLEIQFFH